MQVLVLSPSTDDEDGAKQRLRRLGCQVLESTYLTVDSNALKQADLVVLDGGRFPLPALNWLAQQSKIDLEAPTILFVSDTVVSRLPVDGPYDELVVLPASDAEVYCRLRRIDWKHAAYISPETIKFGLLTIDRRGRVASVEGQPCPLTPREFDLLCFLATRPGQVFNRAMLLDALWDHTYEGGDRTVDVHVRRLRVKLRSAGHYLETVRGVGYKIVVP